MSGRLIKAVIALSAEDRACLAALRATRVELRRRSVAEIGDALAAGDAARVHAVEPVPAHATSQLLAGRTAVLAREVAAHPALRARVQELQALLPQMPPAAEVARELDAIEQLVDAVEDHRNAQTLMLEDVVHASPGWLAVDMTTARRGPDGSLRVSATTDAGGVVGITLGSASHGPRPLDLDMSRAGYDRIRTAKQLLVGCDAGEEVARRFVEHLRSNGVDVALVRARMAARGGADASRKAGA